jgi:hypothetical protein
VAGQPKRAARAAKVLAMEGKATGVRLTPRRRDPSSSLCAPEKQAAAVGGRQWRNDSFRSVAPAPQSLSHTRKFEHQAVRSHPPCTLPDNKRVGRPRRYHTGIPQIAYNSCHPRNCPKCQSATCSHFRPTTNSFLKGLLALFAG